ncbi:hypothetical protein D3C78_1731600 [compost metagenome]
MMICVKWICAALAILFSAAEPFCKQHAARSLLLPKAKSAAQRCFVPEGLTDWS